jgi:hypothetical protein
MQHHTRLSTSYIIELSQIDIASSSISILDDVAPSSTTRHGPTSPTSQQHNTSACLADNNACGPHYSGHATCHQLCLDGARYPHFPHSSCLFFLSPPLNFIGNSLISHETIGNRKISSIQRCYNRFDFFF